jgi:D-3-phosphoglycerate dehydrogenase
MKVREYTYAQGQSKVEFQDECSECNEEIDYTLTSEGLFYDFPDDDIIGVDGAICIPHLGASTPESEDNCASMAAGELIDFLENGNIINSVNFPSISCPRSGKCRICIIHKNIPNMLSSISTVVSNDGINIENMLNKAKGEYAYTMLDIDADGEALKKDLEAIEGVIRIRIV